MLPPCAQEHLGGGGGEGQSGDCGRAGIHGWQGGQECCCVHVHIRGQRWKEERKGGQGWRKEVMGMRGQDRWVPSSEPGLARHPRRLQTVTTSPAVAGDVLEDGEHGVPDSVSQRRDVVWGQPFCGHRGQHPHLTPPCATRGTNMAVSWPLTRPWVITLVPASGSCALSLPARSFPEPQPRCPSWVQWSVTCVSSAHGMYVSWETLIAPPRETKSYLPRRYTRA